MATKEDVVNDVGAVPLLTAARAGSGTGVRWLMSFFLLLAVTTAFFDRINIAVLFNKEYPCKGAHEDFFHSGISGRERVWSNEPGNGERPGH